MTISWKGALATLLAAAMLVVCVDYATFAANGDSLILGKLNHASATTTLSRHGVGPALRLDTTSDSAPLAVTSTEKVNRLNADAVDGRDAATLTSNAVTYRGAARGPDL